MKSLSRKTIFILLAAAIVLTITAGAAWAYFTDYDQMAGTATVYLEGQTEIEEEVTDTSKTVSVKNTGTADVIVKVMIYGPSGMTVEGSPDWEITDNGDGSFTAYHRSILESGDETASIIAKIDNIPVTPENSDVEIIVLQECRAAAFDYNNRVIAPDDWPGFPEITV